MTFRWLAWQVWPYVVRSVRWRPVVVTALLALLVGRATASAPVTLLATLAAAGASFTFDDPAFRTLAASPTSLACRRLLALALVVPLAGLLWAIVVYPLADGPADRVPPGAANLELGTLVAVVLAAAAFAARRAEDGMGSDAAAPVLVAFVLVTALLRGRWALHPVHAQEVQWTLMLLCGAAAVALASRDPASR